MFVSLQWEDWLLRFLRSRFGHDVLGALNPAVGVTGQVGYRFGIKALEAPSRQRSGAWPGAPSPITATTPVRAGGFHCTGPIAGEGNCKRKVIRSA